MKPVLVTGASGFLGWHVARVLVERGYPVRALVRPGSRVDELDVERASGDLRDAESVERAVTGCGVVCGVDPPARCPSACFRSEAPRSRGWQTLP